MSLGSRELFESCLPVTEQPRFHFLDRESKQNAGLRVAPLQELEQLLFEAGAVSVIEVDHDNNRGIQPTLAPAIASQHFGQPV
jgi:hypothetical protein